MLHNYSGILSTTKLYILTENTNKMNVCIPTKVPLEHPGPLSLTGQLNTITIVCNPETAVKPTSKIRDPMSQDAWLLLWLPLQLPHLIKSILRHRYVELDCWTALLSYDVGKCSVKLHIPMM